MSSKAEARNSIFWQKSVILIIYKYLTEYLVQFLVQIY